MNNDTTVSWISMLPFEILKHIFLMVQHSVSRDRAKLTEEYGFRLPLFVFPMFGKKHPLKMIRLVCKDWARIAAPILLRRIRVSSHLYFYEKLVEEINTSKFLKSHVRDVWLDVTSGAHAMYMFQSPLPDRIGVFGATRGLNDDTSKELHARYQRNESLVEGFDEVLRLLPNLKLVELETDSSVWTFSDYTFLSDCPEDLQALQAKLGFYLPSKLWYEIDVEQRTSYFVFLEKYAFIKQGLPTLEESPYIPELRLIDLSRSSRGLKNKAPLRPN